MYQVCDVSPDGEFGPLGLLLSDTTQGELEFRRFKRRCPSPTDFLARVVYTRVEETVPRRRPRAV
jgi:hypothetical protein